MATWVGYPRSYTKGRTRAVQYVVIHTTEGTEMPTSAEDGAAYDRRRTDGTSTHIFCDSDTAVQEVPYADRAHAARFHGNEIGIQVELCGRAGQSVAQWHDGASTAELRVAAREVAAICQAYNLPVRRLTVTQVRDAYFAPSASTRGICGHWDVTRAYPEDQGSHTDPGERFPWDEFLVMVRIEAVRAQLGDDMTPEQFADMLEDPGKTGARVRKALRHEMWGRGTGLTTAGTVVAIAGKVDIDPAELEAITGAVTAGVLASADELVAAVLAALPDGRLTKGDVEDALKSVLRAGVDGP